MTALDIYDLGGEATIDELMPRRAASRSRVRDAVTVLARRGWVERDGDAYVLVAEPSEGLGYVAAVEAKLNNWRRAVAQAQSWEGNVDAVWFAFPRSYVPNFPRLRNLRRFGLIAVDGDRATVIRKASGPRATGLNRALMHEFLYDRWLRQIQGVEHRAQRNN